MKKLSFFNKPHRISREVHVISSHLDIPNENPNADDLGQNLQLPPQSTTTPLVKTLKVVAVPIFAVFSSLSLPILIILIQQQTDSQKTRSLAQKILYPLIPYVILVALRTWLLWNSVGHRLNGRVDADIQPSHANAENDPVHVTVSVFANSASFTTAILGGYAILSNAPPEGRWTAAIILGCLNYTKDFFTEVVDAFRKHVESRLQLGQHIKPFFKQEYIEHVLNSAEKFGLVLREILPIISGIVRSQATTQTLASVLATKVSSNAVIALNLPLGSLVYWSTAYVTKFDLVQFRDNIQAAGKQFEVNNTLSQSSIRPIRVFGKMCSGQILIDVLQTIRFSTPASVNVTLFFNAIGLMTLLQKALQTYVSSTHSDAVEAGQEGIVMNYAFGQQTANRAAPSLEIGIACIAITLSALGTFAKSATLLKQSRLSPTQTSHQIAIAQSDEEANAQIERGVRLS